MKAGVAWPRAGNKAFKGTLSSPLLSLTKWPLPPNVRLTEPRLSLHQLIRARTREGETGPVQQIEGGRLERIFITKNSLQILTVTDGTF